MSVGLLKYAVALCTLVAVLPCKAMAGEQDVVVRSAWGSIAATLASATAPSDTAVLIVAGSGPTDRDGNSGLGLTSYTYKYLSDALMERGFDVLRYDKRGVGQSRVNAMAVADVRFGDFVDDAVSCVGHLRAMGYERVVVAGHSEGALIALEMAQRDDVTIDGVVLLCGPGYTLDVILKRQLAAQLIPAKIGLMFASLRIISSLDRGEMVSLKDIPAELITIFHPSSQPFIISMMECDPQQLAKQCEVPMLVVSGGRDIQVTEDNGERLAAAASAEHIVLADMCHVLKACNTTDRMEQLMTVYSDAKLPLADGLVDAIEQFVNTLR